MCGVFSTHANQPQMVGFVQACAKTERVFVVHGEKNSVACLGDAIKEALPVLKVEQPEMSQRFDLLNSAVAPNIVGPEQVNKNDVMTVVPWNKVNKSHLGQQITVEGTIVEIGKSRTGKAHYLNFAPYKPGATAFYLVIFEGDIAKFDQPLESLYKGRVIGKVEEYQGRPADQSNRSVADSGGTAQGRRDVLSNAPPRLHTAASGQRSGVTQGSIK
jgi:Zn-dependent metallo-hydrolase RNA specificity domain